MTYVWGVDNLVKSRFGFPEECFLQIYFFLSFFSNFDELKMDNQMNYTVKMTFLMNNLLENHFFYFVFFLLCMIIFSLSIYIKYFISLFFLKILFLFFRLEKISSCFFHFTIIEN